MNVLDCFRPFDSSDNQMAVKCTVYIHVRSNYMHFIKHITGKTYFVKILHLHKKYINCFCVILIVSLLNSGVVIYL